ncbi:hypothetical protein CTA2_12377 [Colletotrichum tanaceti]|uniref:Uncharacterized protein n=1 Tax=Colletotrichum tanaceti TaxID=1306861 RepID=A0A4U6XDC9_9PEZI|nr:hypothetical protein CTA2_12377 [Colletotrichum tanaceti]TKW53444.1 hypothetical protein CTA1_6793 [Colletotrichum tanaceti]
MPSVQHKTEHEDEETQKQEPTCGYCQKIGHELADCAHLFVKGRRHVFVSGCPMCNTTVHHYGSCKKLPIGGEELLRHHLEWLVRRRGNLPMIHSNVDIWVLVLGFPDYDGGYPWSRESIRSVRSHAVALAWPNMVRVAASIGAFDYSTTSLAQIKRHISFDVPVNPLREIYDANLLAQGNVREEEVGRGLSPYGKGPARAWRTILDQSGKISEEQKRTMWAIHRAGAISAPAFAAESKTWARAFGNFLLRDSPDGVEGVPFLRELRNRAAKRDEKKRKSRRKLEKDASPPQVTAEPDEQPQPSSKEPSVTSLESRQEIWTALCPRRKCVGRFPFEVPVPPAVRLQKHVLDELEDKEDDMQGRTHEGDWQREEQLAHYIHPHVRIGVAQRRLADGEAVHTLVLGLAEHARDLRFSRLGLLQAYDMVVCWASKIDREGVSISLKSAFDGCNRATEEIVAGGDRIKEMEGLEGQLGRLTPDGSHFDRAVERVSGWLELHKSRLATRPAERERRLRRWCKRKLGELGDMDADLLEEACRRAVKVKTRQWDTGKRGIDDVGTGTDVDGGRPAKRTRMR